MSGLPRPTVQEPPVINSPSVLAPRFRAALQRALAGMRRAGFDPVLAETLRTPERQAFLYGFGRDYDDGRGVVTHVRQSWHTYGLAADVISAARQWDAPETFWGALAAAAKDEGLVAGYTWAHPDKPHVQWGAPMRVAPSDHAAELFARGIEAVWKEVGAL